jgi:hypothetical protein
VPGKTPKTQNPRVPKAKVEREAVARLAYELYLRRGGEHGHAEEDWLMAEQILIIEEKKRSEPHRRASDAARRLEDKFRK